MKRCRVLVVLIFFLLIFAMTTGPSGKSMAAPATKPAASPAPSGKVTLYTSVPQDIVDRLQTDYKAKFPGSTLEVFRAGSSEVEAKLAAERQAGSIQADLIWVAEPSTYEDFKKQGILLQFTPAEATALPPEMMDSEGYYYAGRLINMVVAFNMKANPKPTGWKDLLSPAYKGKLGFPTPASSGAAEAAVRTLVETPGFGWDYFKQFRANGGKQIKNNPALQEQLSTGELLAGGLLDFMIRDAKAKGSPVDYVWPAEGAVFIPSPIAIVKTAKNPVAARAFVDYLLSKEGQGSMVKLGNFIPVRSDVPGPAGTPALGKIKRLATNWKMVREKRQDTKDQFEAIFVK
jgi:iron(III) transport system substrate-binding protein